MITQFLTVILLLHPMTMSHLVNKIVNYFTVSLFLGGEGGGVRVRVRGGGGGSKFRFQVMGMIEWGQK